MNRRLTITFLLSAISIWVILSGISVAQEKGATDAQQNEKAPAFNIKDSINGGSAEDQRRFKQEFGVASSLTANPTAVWFHNYTSRALPTAVIPRCQPVMPLHSKIIPEVGKVTATTNFGKMDLNAFLNHPKSFV